MINLVKAEILWTRKCPLRCSFCAMPNDTSRAPVNKMIEGLGQLKKLGCGFIAIYGASPLYDFEGLPEFVSAAEKMGILTTVIVDGIVPDSKEKLQLLYNSGLRSLTVSYDFVPYDKSSRKKSEAGILLLEWFKSLPELRDVEIVSTVTKDNYKAIVERVEEFIDDGITWFSFDFVHPDRGNPGTKCRGQAREYLPSFDNVRYFCSKMLLLKKKGVRIHQSTSLLKYVFANPEVVTKFSWNCATKEFPSWLTIDADGTVLPCDDFYTDRSFKVWNLDDTTLEEFRKKYYKEIRTKCKGCFWTTHFDAWLIKKGQERFSKYVHK